MKKIVLLIAILISLNAFTAEDVQGELKSYCQDINHLNITKGIKGSGQEAFYFYIKIQDPETKEKRVFDCSAFGIGPLVADENPELEEFSGDLTCLKSEDTNTISNLLNLQKSVLEVSEKITCEPEEKTPIPSIACGEEMGCNLIRSAINISTLGAYSYLGKLLSKDSEKSKDSCLGVGQSDCSTEVIAGVLKNIWSNIEGIGFLLKSAGSMAWNGVKNFAGSLFGSEDAQVVEDKSSEAMHLASGESEEEVDTFTKAPLKYMKNLGSKIYKYMVDTIGNSFGCAEWAGAPHLSECVKKLESWECSTCEQRLNGFCGVLGFAGGEIVTGFLTGGTINLLGKAGRATKIANAFSGLGKSKFGKSSGAALAAIGKPVGKVILYSFSKIGKTGKKLKLDKVGKFTGLSQYLHLTEKAFMKGLTVGKKESKVLATLTSNNTKPVLAWKDAEKVIDKSRKGLVGDEAKVLSSIENLKNLRHDKDSFKGIVPGDYNNKVMGVVGDLVNVARNHPSSEVRLVAMKAAAEYADKASNGYKVDFIGRRAPEVFDSVYKDYRLSDEVRLVAHQELQKSGSVSAFETSVQLGGKDRVDYLWESRKNLSSQDRSANAIVENRLSGLSDIEKAKAHNAIKKNNGKLPESYYEEALKSTSFNNFNHLDGLERFGFVSRYKDGKYIYSNQKTGAKIITGDREQYVDLRNYSNEEVAAIKRVIKDGGEVNLGSPVAGEKAIVSKINSSNNTQKIVGADKPAFKLVKSAEMKEFLGSNIEITKSIARSPETFSKLLASIGDEKKLLNYLKESKDNQNTFMGFMYEVSSKEFSGYRKPYFERMRDIIVNSRNNR